MWIIKFFLLGIICVFLTAGTAFAAPSISSVIWESGSNSGYIYGTLRIAGSGFGSDPGNGKASSESYNVKIGGLKVFDYRPSSSGYGIESWTNTQIYFRVALSLEGTYLVAGDLSLAVTSAGSISNTTNFELKPRIYALSPDEGKSGDAVTFVGTAYGTNPGSITVNFGGVATLAATANNTTLTAIVPSGVSPGEIAVSITINGKTSNAEDFEVINPGLSVTPTSLSFSGTVTGSNPSSQTLTLRNNGSGTLSWTASKTSSWLSISPVGGYISSGSYSLMVVSVNISGLYATIYTDTIKITSNGGNQDITVSLTLASPPFFAGYTNGSWEVKQFTGSAGLFNLQLSNLQTADQPVATVANNLNGTTNVVKANIAGKKMAVLNHESGFTLYPPGAGISSTSPFPSIWIKGNTTNETTSASDAPPTYLEPSSEAKYFYQTGLTIQAPYWLPDNYQWTVYVYANKDILSQMEPSSGQGRILDPRISTLRWWAWADDSEGIPRKAWGYKITENGSTNLYLFNTLPLINSSDISVIKNYLTSDDSIPETNSDLGVINDNSEASIPTDGKIYYNTDRNNDTVNGFSIQDRSQMGLIYVSPSGDNSRRTEKLRLQFLAIWPPTIGLTTGAKSCEIGFYQKTTN